MYDIVLRNGKIIDGSGSPWFYGDIGITGDQIAFIGKIAEGAASNEYNMQGLTICPGFIDMHCHSDLVILSTPYIAAKIRQGITTDLLGQDGISAAPLPHVYKEAWQSNLSGLDGTPDIEWDWSDVGSYLDKIERAKPSYNVAYLVPHGNLRMEVIGLSDRTATPDEIEQMKELLRRSLDQGGSGLSSGLIYLPCMYAHYDEVEGLCEVAAAYGVPFIVHQRSEGDEILESMDELLDIARRTGVHLHFSHFKVCGRLNWDKTEAVLKKLDDARLEGLEVTFDQYPYTAGSTMLSATLPSWAHDGGSLAMLKRLEDTEQRERIASEMKTGLPGWDSIYAWAGAEGIIITSVHTDKNKRLVGKTLLEAAELMGKPDPITAALDLIVEESNAVGMIDFVMDEPSVSAIMRHPAGTICTDGLLGGEPHPRAYGSFPKVLGHYARKKGLFSLEEAIRRMTSQPARIIGYTDRGLIRQGLKADLVVFNEATVIDTATYDQPRSYPIGIDYVFVNGQAVVEKERMNEIPAGRVLRRHYS
jgi:N-acyl-D-amino-acid deacylase